eukprot:7766089-Heterocapsa_arctica.AAC.1
MAIVQQRCTSCVSAKARWLLAEVEGEGGSGQRGQSRQDSEGEGSQHKLTSGRFPEQLFGEPSENRVVADSRTWRL